MLSKTTPRLAIVAAVAENGVIGAEGGLPWRIRADLRRFRALTLGKPVIMGRKTFQSLGRALDGRDNIVVTRQPDFSPEGAHVVHDLPDALALANTLASERGVDEVYVIGGGELYAQALPLAERLYLTHVAASPAGDVAFPPIPVAEWREMSREALPASDGDTASAVNSVYHRHR